MVPPLLAVLTRIGFRRDVKLFLTTLVGFLVVLILGLALVLQASVSDAVSLVRESQAQTARVATREISEHATGSTENLIVALDLIRTRYDIVAIEITDRHQTIARSGLVPPRGASIVETATPAGTVTCWFDDTEAQTLETTARRIGLLSVTATLIGTILLLLYLPRILAPIETMLDHAAELGEARPAGEDEAGYLIETFRATIAKLKDREAELRRLHDEEKQELKTLADLGEISGGIAHEFRNSLSTILGYLALARRGALTPEAEGRVRNAEAEATQLSGAVDALLQFARPMEMQNQTFDLGGLVLETCGRLESLAREDAEITCQVEAVQVKGDPLLLGRAVENLVRNGIEAVRKKGMPGRVSVRVSASPQPRVVVRDTGPGIDPARIPKLFLPFQSDKPGGPGFGLALARKIVLMHGGTIRLTGLPDEGATATIELPRFGQDVTIRNIQGT